MYIPEQREGYINILMAEDNEADVLVSQRAFRKASLKTNLFIVDDGLEALDFVHNKGPFGDAEKYPRPDVMLLDIKMPKLTGIQVLGKIKNDENVKGIPCVMLTSSRNDEDVVKSYFDGAASYISKPVDYDHFIKVVECFNFYWIIMNAKVPHEFQEVMDTKILIVEDEEDAAETIKAMLAKRGFRCVSCVSTGEDALKKVKTQKGGFVVVDIERSGMNGMNLCEKICALDNCDAKIILITEDKNCVDIIKQDLSGSVEYLVKSSDYNNLLHSMRRFTK